MEIIGTETVGDMTTVTHFDEMAGKVFVERIQDTKPYVERAKALQEHWNSDARRKSDMYYAGSIPAVLVEKYCNDHKIRFAEFVGSGGEHVRKMLNDPDYAHLRVWKGRV